MCEHENQLDDDREGHVVCVDCGLVLEPIYQNPPKNIDKNILLCHNSKNNVITTVFEPQKIHNNLKNETMELENLCNKLHFYFYTKNKILEQWEIIKKWVLDTKMRDRKNPQYRKGLIVMTIYQSLVELDIPRPMSHLCQDVGISQKYVWYWIKLYNKTQNKGHKLTILNPTSMSEYFLKPLNLSYKDIQEINNEVKNNEVLTYAPKTILASCAYMFLKNNKKQNISVQKIANLLGVSVMSVYRCITALKNNA